MQNFSIRENGFFKKVFKIICSKKYFKFVKPINFD